MAGVDWAVVDRVGPWVLVGLVVAGLAWLGLRTAAGRDLASAAGVRMVKVLLVWLEVRLAAELDKVSGGTRRAYVGARLSVRDGRLARVRALRRLAGDL
jgi:hypothetical protein